VNDGFRDERGLQECGFQPKIMSPWFDMNAYHRRRPFLDRMNWLLGMAQRARIACSYYAATAPKSPNMASCGRVITPRRPGAL